MIQRDSSTSWLCSTQHYKLNGFSWKPDINVLGHQNISCVTLIYSKWVCNCFKHRNLSVDCRKSVNVLTFCFHLKRKKPCLDIYFVKYIWAAFSDGYGLFKQQHYSCFLFVLSIRLYIWNHRYRRHMRIHLSK